MTTAEATEADTPNALHVLKRGIRESPELRRGLGATLAAALLSSAGRLVLPIIIQQAIDRGFETAPDGSTTVDVDLVVRICVFGSALLVVVFVLDRITLWRLLNTGEQALSSLRVRAFAHIHSLSIAEHTLSRRGQLTARVTSDTETLSRFLQWGGLTWIRQTAVIVGAAGAMFWYSWKLASIVLLIYLPIVPVLRFFQRRQFQSYNRVRNSVGSNLGLTSESIAGAATIRAYDYADEARSRLESSNRTVTNNQIQAHKYFAGMSPTMNFFSALAIGGSIVAGVSIGGDELTVGQFGAFLFLLTILAGPISQLAEVLDQTQTALAGWWKIQSLFDIENDVVDPEPSDSVELKHEPPTVDFDAVDFTYRTGEQVLHDLSFSIPAGTSVALVGETGSGKTTIAKLITRFADPTSGAVRVGGHDVRRISAETRKRTIRMVPQDGFLFDTTISENILFGRQGATRADVDAAVQRLGLDDWLASLPNGLDTEVGERGDNVSVGERQLISLIRAQVADAGLLILDEATSSVDPEIEKTLSDALDRLSKNRTTISIAHRMSTAERSDLILVLDQGRLVEQGTHQQLVTARGFYYRLYHALEAGG